MSSELLPPSSVNTFWSEKDPAVMPLGEVPGCSTARVAASRPMLGSFISDSLVSVLPTVALVVCKSAPTDRKSTRLNSSHLGISYAVFCLKKKRKFGAGQAHGFAGLGRSYQQTSELHY